MTSEDANGVTRGWQYQPDVPDHDTERWMTGDEAAVVREAEEALHEWNVFRATGAVPTRPKISDV
jgi:hypothetical protein